MANDQATLNRAAGYKVPIYAVGDPAPDPNTDLIAEQARGRAACRTLAEMGYTYHGGILWKPPLGPLPAFEAPIPGKPFGRAGVFTAGFMLAAVLGLLMAMTIALIHT